MCYVQDSVAIVGPKLGYREKIIALTDQPIDTLLMSSGQASSLRGSLGPLDVGLFGRVCRGASSALIARQYYELTLAVHTLAVHTWKVARAVHASGSHLERRGGGLCAVAEGEAGGGAAG